MVLPLDIPRGGLQLPLYVYYCPYSILLQSKKRGTWKERYCYQAQKNNSQSCDCSTTSKYENRKKYCSCEIEDFVETHICKLCVIYLSLWLSNTHWCYKCTSSSLVIVTVTSNIFVMTYTYNCGWLCVYVCGITHRKYCRNRLRRH